MTAMMKQCAITPLVALSVCAMYQHLWVMELSVEVSTQCH